jgi:hypothetical protein
MNLSTPAQTPDLVRQSFCQWDVETIFRIPIHAHIDEHVAWHYESCAVFPVKSAYKVFALATKDKLAQPRVIEVVHWRRTERVEPSLEAGVPAESP